LLVFLVILVGFSKGLSSFFGLVLELGCFERFVVVVVVCKPLPLAVIEVLVNKMAS